jgi:hypothetical protein
VVAEMRFSCLKIKLQKDWLSCGGRSRLRKSKSRNQVNNIIKIERNICQEKNTLELNETKILFLCQKTTALVLNVSQHVI